MRIRVAMMGAVVVQGIKKLLLWRAISGFLQDL
jgi:hypothetical protein